MAQPRTPKGSRRRHLAVASAEGGECGTAGGAPREQRRRPPPPGVRAEKPRGGRETGRRPRVGGRWPREKVRDCGVAAPRRGIPGARARRLTQATERHGRAGGSPGLDAAAHERCRFPRTGESRSWGRGAAPRGRVHVGGGRGPRRAARPAWSLLFADCLGLWEWAGGPAGRPTGLAQSQSVCSARTAARLSLAGSQRGSHVCTAAPETLAPGIVWAPMGNLGPLLPPLPLSFSAVWPHPQGLGTAGRLGRTWSSVVACKA